MIINLLPDYLACPNCGETQKMRTMKSCNTCGASHWSDAVMNFPMILSYPDVLRCPKCKSFFWFTDRIKIGEIDFDKSINESKYKNAQYIDKLTVEEYYLAIKSKFCNSVEVEKTLRVAAWRRWNDTLRGCGDKTVFAELLRIERWEDNLKELYYMLDENDENECLIKGEICRNLGRFQEAKEIFMKINNPELQDIVSQLIGYCDKMEFEMKRIK